MLKYKNIYFTCMLSLVRLQLGLSKEPFSAVAAEELEVAGVPAHVRQQVPSIAKLLFALKTN
jgi:hypothetical protein